MFELSLSHSKDIEFILTYDCPLSARAGTLVPKENDCSGRLGCFYVLEHDKKVLHLINPESRGLIRSMRLLMTTLLSEQGRLKDCICRWKELYGFAAPAVKTAEGKTLFHDLMRLSHLRILERLLRRDYRGVSLPQDHRYLDWQARPRAHHDLGYLDYPQKGFLAAVGASYRLVMNSQQNKKTTIAPKTAIISHRSVRVLHRPWCSAPLALEAATVRLLRAASQP